MGRLAALEEEEVVVDLEGEDGSGEEDSNFIVSDTEEVRSGNVMIIGRA